ncbi:MAG: GNAT family N-acetyltransferase [Dehalococcoidia bacterium]
MAYNACLLVGSEFGWSVVMEQLVLRQAWPEEAAAIAALVQRAYAKYVTRMDHAPAPMLADYPALIDAGVVYVVPRGERLAGVVVMWPEGDHLFLENIAVDPADQGTGLGRQLMQFVDQHARALGLAAVELYTNEVMTENLAFYPRLGFIGVARRMEAGYRRVFMRKNLAPPLDKNASA